VRTFRQYRYLCLLLHVCLLFLFWLFFCVFFCGFFFFLCVFFLFGCDVFVGFSVVSMHQCGLFSVWLLPAFFFFWVLFFFLFFFFIVRACGVVGFRSFAVYLRKLPDDRPSTEFVLRS